MKDGAPTLTTDGSGLRVAVVAASWHQQVMDCSTEPVAASTTPA
jgi:6,7-dimethyl-8-ribityllumazine synthase